MFFSIIIPVFNRPDEVNELLHSLTQQTEGTFEVVVVDDGSSMRCEDVVEGYHERLTIRYYYKENSGPGSTRNYAAQRSEGEYLIILDSDCILPPGYFSEVLGELNREACDAFGGPDRASDSFSNKQKAINYAMTSFITTGGIRGGKRRIDRFYPRSFNLGVRRVVFEKLGGFSDMRFGEDIDFSYRLVGAGYSTRLLPLAWVYHKRRSNFRQFFKQVYNSGIARIALTKIHKGTLKLVHLLPSLFTLGCLVVLISGVVFPPLLLLFLLFAVIIFIDSSVRTRSAMVGVLSVGASFVQLWGYGCGFVVGWWRICVRGDNTYKAFEKTFYD